MSKTYKIALISLLVLFCTASNTRAEGQTMLQILLTHQEGSGRLFINGLPEKSFNGKGSEQLSGSSAIISGINKIRLETSSANAKAQIYDTPVGAFPNEGTLLAELIGSGSAEFTYDNVEALDWHNGQPIQEADCAQAIQQIEQAQNAIQNKDFQAFTDFVLSPPALNSLAVQFPDFRDELDAYKDSFKADLDGFNDSYELKIISEESAECFIADSSKLLSIVYQGQGSGFIAQPKASHDDADWTMPYVFMKDETGNLVIAY